MRLIDAKNGAKRMRDNGMTFEFGRWRVSNALTQNYGKAYFSCIKSNGL